ncbi:transcriptional repressor [Roseomonas frigidaquae]|uniref:Transcriptional repressor n=1 Tax=Falsiroseomonas frigidaquae TaxID=487318 RepID=A0ABX1F640_9PROT|nr:Fur family transcriptional regulator [Falsiroseomonas frigidaquae]NKE47790.1 transcriptional repressor [Falsiroseomonas frigidaquae]
MAESMRADAVAAPDPALEAALDRAATSCLHRGAQLTELRRQVLRLVLQAEQPIGAYALLDRLRGARRGAAPPTVYRALDFLLGQGLIHKVERLNAFIGCDEAGHGHAHGEDHPHQFLICGKCGATAEICDPATSAAVAAAAARQGFVPHRTTVEVEGICARCANDAAPGAAAAG